MIVLLIVWVDLPFANMCAIMLISATASRVEAKARTTRHRARCLFPNVPTTADVMVIPSIYQIRGI